MIRERDEAHAVVEHLNTDLMALRKLLSADITAQLELRDVQDPFPPFEARWKSAREHSKPLSAIPPRSLSYLLWVRLSWHTKSAVQGRLRRHC